jgi:hypothetical protein
MKASARTTTGGPASLADLPDPKAGAGMIGKIVVVA